MNDDPLAVARFLADGMVRPDLIEIFDRLNGGDESAVEEFRPLMDRVDPDVVWDSTELHVPDFPDVVVGLPGIIEFFASWLQAWQEFDWRNSNFEGRGDDVIYDVHIQAYSRATAVPIDIQIAHRMTIRDGKLVAWRAFRDRADA